MTWLFNKEKREERAKVYAETFRAMKLKQARESAVRKAERDAMPFGKKVAKGFVAMGAGVNAIMQGMNEMNKQMPRVLIDPDLANDPLGLKRDYPAKRKQKRS